MSSSVMDDSIGNNIDMPSYVINCRKLDNPTEFQTFRITDDLRLDISLNMYHEPNEEPFVRNPERLPQLVGNYHELVPLEPAIVGPWKKFQLASNPTSTYSARCEFTGKKYCLRRLYGFKLEEHATYMSILKAWRNIRHPNIVQLIEFFPTKLFGDDSIIFVYDYYPHSRTLYAKHLSHEEKHVDPNNVCRSTHHNKIYHRYQKISKLPEELIWNYIIQIISALRVIHAANLACRAINVNKIIRTDVTKIKLSCPGIMEVMEFNKNASASALMGYYKQADFLALGKLVLQLASNSLVTITTKSVQESLEFVSKTYSSDLKDFIEYLLVNTEARSVNDLIPIIGERYHTYIDNINNPSPVIRKEMSQEVENNRLFILLVILDKTTKSPGFNFKISKKRKCKRYILKLFRDYVFRQVVENGKILIDMDHVVECLSKLEMGTEEIVQLLPHSETEKLVSYADLKRYFLEYYEYSLLCSEV